jgi:hypothetical protein
VSERKQVSDRIVGVGFGEVAQRLKISELRGTGKGVVAAVAVLRFTEARLRRMLAALALDQAVERS